ncbi:MAG: SPOR domain-containing protein [Candidatus Omnitrophota bacterium]
MKNQWPFWVFILVIIAAVIFALNYQKQTEVVPLNEIFSEEYAGEEVEYEFYRNGEEEVKPLEKPAARTEEQESGKKEKEGIEQIQPVKEILDPEIPPEVTDSAKEKSTVSTAKGPYAIQILSSKDREKANAALERVKKKGFGQAYLASVDLEDKGTWYRIYAGAYSTKDKAQQALPEVQKTYSGAFIIKTQ